jgi:hypothetical protein
VTAFAGYTLPLKIDTSLLAFIGSAAARWHFHGSPTVFDTT